MFLSQISNYLSIFPLSSFPQSQCVKINVKIFFFAKLVPHTGNSERAGSNSAKAGR